MEALILLFNNPVLLAILLFAFAVLAICGVSFKFNFKQFSLSVLKPESVGERITNAINIAEHYTKEICKAQNSILKNQMNYGEKILDDIADICHIKKQDLYIAKLKLKIAFKENGIEALDAESFSRYVGLKIDLLRSEFKLLTTDLYINSPDFSDKVGDMYNHALNCSNYWYKKVSELEAEKEIELEEIYNPRR